MDPLRSVFSCSFGEEPNLLYDSLDFCDDSQLDGCPWTLSRIGHPIHVRELHFLHASNKSLLPLTLICQFFITCFYPQENWSSSGLDSVRLYMLFAGLVAYAKFPVFTTVLVVVCILRVFEYGFNKPARETIFTVIKQTGTL